MSRQLHYLRALGWGALAAAPTLLVALAVVSSRPEAPASLVTRAALGAWIAGTLAFGAALVRERGGRRASVVLGALSGFVVAAVIGTLVWVAVALGAPTATPAGGTPQPAERPPSAAKVQEGLEVALGAGEDGVAAGELA